MIDLILKPFRHEDYGLALSGFTFACMVTLLLVGPGLYYNALYMEENPHLGNCEELAEKVGIDIKKCMEYGHENRGATMQDAIDDLNKSYDERLLYEEIP